MFAPVVVDVLSLGVIQLAICNFCFEISMLVTDGCSLAFDGAPFFADTGTRAAEGSMRFLFNRYCTLSNVLVEGQHMLLEVNVVELFVWS